MCPEISICNRPFKAVYTWSIFDLAAVVYHFLCMWTAFKR